VARACDAAAGVTVPIDGSTTLTMAGPTQLFGGAIPPTGYMVQVYSNTQGGNYCWVNDNGPAALNVGFGIGVNSGVSFVTPKGYTPLGPVSIWCLPGLFVPPSNAESLSRCPRWAHMLYSGLAARHTRQVRGGLRWQGHAL
jgi:hypothetical protein